jgi:isopentenyldiphosphate isomerase/intracellular septation protein A
MRQNNILLSFLPGFAPILIYIVVEAVFGETAGLVAGIALGLGEFAVILFRERRVDAFTLVDTVLLAVMGAVSWALSDPVFFRLKPAISGAILSVMMIAGALGPHRLFLPYMEQKMGLGEIPEAAVSRMLGMIAGFGFLTLAHSALTAVAALFWSKSAWNFVAGALFWILAALYMAAWTVPALVSRFVAARRSMAGSLPASSKSAGPAIEGAGEMLPIVDPEGRVVGKAPRPLCHSGSAATGNAVNGQFGASATGETRAALAGTAVAAKLLHPVVRLWLTDGKGGVWMQKRAETKLVQPGKWDCAVGGHISFGETAEAALRRETREEIGLLDPGAVKPIGKFIWETELERELVFVFQATISSAAAFRVDPAEVSEIRLWSGAELAREAASAECSLTPLAVRELATLRTAIA